MSAKPTKEFFRRISRRSSELFGSSWAFFVAITVVLVWALTGPMFGFSDTWQLIINTGTTIVTFLMVFLIQNTQNRDTLAIHLKLDELIRSIKAARNSMIDLDALTDEDLQRLQNEFQELCRRRETFRAPDGRTVAEPADRIGETGSRAAARKS